MSLQGYKSLFAVADLQSLPSFLPFTVVFWSFLKEKGKRQIALQQDPFRSLFDSLAVFVRFKRDLFICSPLNGLGGGAWAQLRTKTNSSQNCVSNSVRLYFEWVNLNQKLQELLCNLLNSTGSPRNAAITCVAWFCSSFSLGSPKFGTRLTSPGTTWEGFSIDESFGSAPSAAYHKHEWNLHNCIRRMHVWQALNERMNSCSFFSVFFFLIPRSLITGAFRWHIPFFIH